MVIILFHGFQAVFPARGWGAVFARRRVGDGMANAIFDGCGTSVFEEMSRLAAAHGAINLGQGFPVGMEPAAVIDAAVRALAEGPHQYPPMLGLPELRQAVADNAHRFWGLDLDWRDEVVVTSGATEALADCFLGLLNPGDEVLVFQPAYDSYGTTIRRAGGVPVPIRLQPPHWDLPRQHVLEAITPKTRLIVLNTPMNPIGKVFSHAELLFLADIMERHDLLCVCDEVYEHLTFDGKRHQSLMSIPGARHRCLRVGSAGKTFSVTGWKVGYVTGDRHVLAPVSRAHQYQTFTTAPFLQRAVAFGLGQPDDYFDGLRTVLQGRRDLLRDGLLHLGLEILECAGTYFLCAGVAGFGATDDLDLCRRLTVEAGVTPVPVSSFYAERDMRSQVRFCFAKQPDDLNEALNRLDHWLSSQRRVNKRTVHA